jgi:hypothetical protein
LRVLNLFGLSSVPQLKLVGLEAVEPLDEPGYLGDLWKFECDTSQVVVGETIDLWVVGD